MEFERNELKTEVNRGNFSARCGIPKRNEPKTQVFRLLCENLCVSGVFLPIEGGFLLFWEFLTRSDLMSAPQCLSLLGAFVNLRVSGVFLPIEGGFLLFWELLTRLQGVESFSIQN